jgi:eukaryotic-like serine/threonine-protein kinase
LRPWLEVIREDPHGLRVRAAHSTTPAPWWLRAIPHAITGATVAIIAVGATLVVINSRTSPRSIAVSRFAITLPADHRFVNPARHFITISPDGTNIVYAANGQLYLRRIGDTEVRPIQGTLQNAGRTFFSPDGQWVGYVARTERKLKKIAIAGGAAVTISDTQDAEGFGLTWSADDYIYVGTQKGITRVSANGGTPERIITLKDGETAHRPQLLPDGDTLLFTLETGGPMRWETAQIVAQSLKSGQRKVLISGGSDARYIPTGHILYAVGATIVALPFDPKTLRTRGPVPVIDGVRRATNSGGGGADAQFAVADNGSLVYVPGGPSTANELALVTVDRSGARKPLQVSTGPYVFPRISPDATRLAVTKDDGTERSIWTADLNDRGTMQRITFEGRNYNPLWTRDGQRIVFTSDRDGEPALFSQRVDGGPVERIAKVDSGVFPQAEGWSPDARTLFFTRRTGGGGMAGAGGIAMLAVGGSGRQRECSHEGGHARQCALVEFECLPRRPLDRLPLGPVPRTERGVRRAPATDRRKASDHNEGRSEPALVTRWERVVFRDHRSQQSDLGRWCRHDQGPSVRQPETAAD